MKRVLLLAWLLGAAAAFAQQDDPVMRAMRDELERSKSLKIPNTPPVYYIEYALDDVDTYSVTASLGAVVSHGENKIRAPRVAVRVGDRKFDNTNYIFSDFFARGGGSRLPHEDDYDTTRHYFWLSTDRVFKGSLQGLARKSSALRNITQQERLNDFAGAEPLQLDLGKSKPAIKRDEWTAMAKRLSAIFREYPKIINSAVEIDAGFGTSYFVNSEGSRVRFPDDLFSVRIRASAQAPDGMPVHDGLAFHARKLESLASEDQIRAQVVDLAKALTAVIGAPMGDDYSGPVLIESSASPQLFAQVLGNNLGLTRKPVLEPGRAFPFPVSELEGRFGSRILPEWMDVVDDATLESFEGRELLGTYAVDMEGVKPTPLTVVEAGKVKSFLLTRTPVRGYEGSNGHARLPGVFGGKLALYSNMFVNAKESVPGADLKKRLIDLINQRGKPYGMILRRLDFPATVSNDELQKLSVATSQRGGGKVISVPVLAYRVFPDGREELVRGLRFRGVNVRSFRDVIAASKERVLFSYIGNGGQLPGINTGGYVAGHSVIAPALLFEDLELDKREEDWPKLPLAPPPTLVSQR